MWDPGRATDSLLRRLAAARHAQLATVRPDGRPHVVPITFALDGRRLVTAVDHKPKRTAALQRLRNIQANPAVSVLADHYEEDWRRLWWVRADGVARVVENGAAWDDAVAALQRRYAAYRRTPPQGPAIIVDVERVTGWQADGVRG
jgi:PPOX class probable F420-dependent enzyme